MVSLLPQKSNPIRLLIYSISQYLFILPTNWLACEINASITSQQKPPSDDPQTMEPHYHGRWKFLRPT